MNTETEHRAQDRRSNVEAMKLHLHIEQCPHCRTKPFGTCETALAIFLSLGADEREAEMN